MDMYGPLGTFDPVRADFGGPIDKNRLRFALGAVEGGQDAARCKLSIDKYMALLLAIYALMGDE